MVWANAPLDIFVNDENALANQILKNNLNICYCWKHSFDALFSKYCESRLIFIQLNVINRLLWLNFKGPIYETSLNKIYWSELYNPDNVSKIASSHSDHMRRILL